MAMSAQRFKFLDKETNLPTKEFTDLIDNQVYNTVTSTVDTALAEVQASDELLNSVNSSVSELQNMLSSGLSAVNEGIKNALNMALDAISKLELPGIIKDLFNSLKELDLGGVKSFVKDLLGIGKAILCNSLDFLKLFMLGYGLNGNILAGLLTALLFSWLDRICKPFSKDEISLSSPLENLEKMVQPRGVVINTSNAFKAFSDGYTDFVKANRPISLDTPISTTTFISNINQGNISLSIDNLRNSEISSSDKKNYLSAIDNELINYSPASSEYANLLRARGSLINLPLISSERREKSIGFSNLSDRLGSISKNLLKVDLSTINKFSFNELERGLFDKINEFKSTVENNKDMHSRDFTSGSFNDFNFNTVLPSLSEEELTYIENKEGSNSAHRIHDMHPTSTIFLEA